MLRNLRAPNALSSACSDVRVGYDARARRASLIGTHFQPRVLRFAEGKGVPVHEAFGSFSAPMPADGQEQGLYRVGLRVGGDKS